MTDDSSGGLCCICLKECRSHSCTACKLCHPFPVCGRLVVEGYGGGVLCAKCDPENKGNIEEDAIEERKSVERIQGNLALFKSSISPIFPR